MLRPEVIWPGPRRITAERVREDSHSDWTRYTADSMLQPAYEFLQPLEAAAGHAEVAKLLFIQNEAFARG